MDNNNLADNLKKSVQEILSKMDFEAQIEIDANQTDSLIANIQSDEAGLLIGQDGENLSALQHIIRIVVNKKRGPDAINFIVDVNSYKTHRLGHLKEMALSLAKEVADGGQAKTLEPMPAYERRTIHLILKDFKGVKTESQGEGQLRRVVIKPGNDSIH